MRTLALWLHILGAGVWLGANITLAVVGPRLARDRGAVLPWLRAVEAASGPIYGVASVLIIITGVTLVLISDGAYTFGSAFVGIGIAVVLVGGATAGLVFSKKTKQMIGMLEADGDPASIEPIYRSIGVWGTVDTLLVVFAVLAMVAKWGA